MSNSILSYASKLLPTFRKDRIIEEARLIETELSTNTIPAYDASSTVFAAKDVRSPVIKKMQSEYFSAMGGSNNKGMVADIATRMRNVLTMVNNVTTAAEKEFETSIVIDGITVYKVSLIKILELSGFVSRYSLRLLNYLYVLECGATAGDGTYVGQQLSKGEIKELEHYFFDYCRTLKALSKADKNFIKDLEKLPNVTVGANSEATMANTGSSRLDPHNLFALQGFVSLTYRLGMMVAEFQVSRYKEAKELKTNLELRRIYLDNLRANGQADEGTQREIDVIQSRIDRCTEVIRKEEEKVGM